MPLLSFVVWSVVGVLIFKTLGPQIDGFIQNTEWLSHLRTNLTLAAILEVSADFIAGLLLMVLLFPLVVWTSLVLTAAFAMPWILRLLRPMYPTAFQSRTRVSLVSTWLVSLRIFAKVVPLYFLLLLLAWIPQVYLIGTFILSAWVNAYFMSVEVLSELTDEQTLRKWIRSHRTPLFAMGAMTVLLLFVPFIQWITPVFAGLWIAHYVLAHFARERA